MKRRIGLVLLAFMAAVVLGGCSSTTETQSSKTGELEIKYAQNMDIQYLDDDIVLVLDGQERPTLILPDEETEIPEGYEDAQVIYGGAEHVFLGSTTHSSYMRVLGDDIFDKVAGVSTYDVGQGQIEQIDSRLADGTIKFFGKNKALDYEGMLEAGVDLAFISYSNADETGKKLEELGIPYFVDSSGLESTVMGRMEYTKMLAVFMGNADAANEQIDTAAANLEEIQKTTAELDAPKVAGGYIYKGQVLVRNGGSYMGDIYKIINADYLYKDFNTEDTGNSYVNLEDFYVGANEAEILFYEPMGHKTYDNIGAIFAEEAPLLMDLPAVQNGQVWSFAPDWFQNVDKLDQIVADYAAIVHPDAYPDREITYMIKVPVE